MARRRRTALEEARLSREQAEVEVLIACRSWSKGDRWKAASWYRDTTEFSRVRFLKRIMLGLNGGTAALEAHALIGLLLH